MNQSRSVFFARFACGAALVVLGLQQGEAQAAQFSPGWTLAGNSRKVVIDVPAVFGTKSAPVTGVTDAVNTIWKWDAIGQKWAFFTPTMDLDQLAAFADSKGYTVLKSIFPGEGYWVNASKSVAIVDATAPAFTLGPWALTSGFNLVATGSAPTASQFSESIAPFSATTLWAWDSALNNWYFHTPAMDSTQLAGYIAQKNYLGFAGRTLGDGTGFWVNRSPVTGSPTANLAPLDQAKQMFSELRTTFHAFTNSAGTGSLDDQVRRMGRDLDGVVMPSAAEVLHRARALSVGTRLFRAVKSGNSAYFFNAASGTYVAVKNDFASAAAKFLFPTNRVVGYGYVTCATNTLSGSTSTAVTEVTCNVFGEKPLTIVNATTQREQYVRLTITETASRQYAFKAQGRERTVVSGFSTAVDIGDNYSGSLGETVDANGVPQTLALAGDFPALTEGLAKITANLNVARSLQLAGTPYSTYRYAVTGSLSAVTAAGASTLSASLETGSYFDLAEDALGHASANSSKELNVVGLFQTKGTRFNGTLNAKAFSTDAEGFAYIPTDLSFSGKITDISAGGSGAILDVTLNLAASNYAAYRTRMPESASNSSHSSMVLNGTIKLPSRPLMALTLNDTNTGPNTMTLSGQYTYGNGVVISISGTHDYRWGNANLTFVNQDGVVLTRPPIGNGMVTKGGTTLGQLSKGVIYYSDGVFESLN